MAGRSFLPAAYKLHNFDLGPLRKHSLGPAWLFDDPPVQFDRNACRIDAQFTQ